MRFPSHRASRHLEISTTARDPRRSHGSSSSGDRPLSVESTRHEADAESAHCCRSLDQRQLNRTTIVVDAVSRMSTGAVPSDAIAFQPLTKSIACNFLRSQGQRVGLLNAFRMHGSKNRQCQKEETMNQQTLRPTKGSTCCHAPDVLGPPSACHTGGWSQGWIWIRQSSPSTSLPI